VSKIAVTKGTLRIPPTYFAVQHALELAEEFDFELFTMVAEIGDAAIARRMVINDASAGTWFASDRQTWARRERALPLLFRRTARQITAWRPALVHQHFANWSQPAVAAAQTAGVPLLLTLHGSDVFLPLTPLGETKAIRRPLLRWHQDTVRRAFGAAQRMLAVSEYLADAAVRAGADHRRVEVHYQGIDTDLFRPAPRPDQGVPTVVFVGALSQAKGVRDLITASVSLRKTTEHELVIVGDGPLRGEVDRAAELNGHIDVRGPQNSEGVRAALNEATVFVLPTQRYGQWREAAGLVSLEAQACGVPAIVYDSGGAAEMVDDGSTGLVVPEGDIPALTDAMRSVLELPPSEWQAMSARAREFVVTQRSLRESARRLSAHYRDLIT